MAKLQILKRQVDDWVEIYINGDLVHDGSVDDFSLDVLLALAQYIDEDGIADVEVREVNMETESTLATEENDGNSDDYKARLFTITDKNYWEDWKDAEVIYPEEISSEE